VVFFFRICKKLPSKKAVATTNTAAKKGPTTTFPLKRMAEKKKEAGKSTKYTMAVKPTPEGVSSEEVFLRAAEALEKEVTLSDEELMEA
jgi:hypothetical protein